MKRKFIYATVIILMIPFTLASAQEKKTEQKIKILVNDGSETKVIMDTIFTDNTGPDSLKLKDGSVVYMKHARNEQHFKQHNGKDHFFVTYSGDGNEHGKKYKEITVISSDSINSSGDGNVMYYSNSKSDSFSNSNSGDGSHNMKYKIIKRNSNESDDTFNVFVNRADNDSTVNRTKYVIAKDGIVVTVEGNDEAKAKELVKEIEVKLGINNENEKKKK